MKSISPEVIEINRLHGEAAGHVRHSRERLVEALKAAWKAGNLLIEQKKRVQKAMKAGAWMIWLQINFEGSPRTAQRYMRLAKTEPDISRLSGLSLRQAYLRLGIGIEPKSESNRAQIDKLPEHIRLAHKFIIALKPCADVGSLRPEQCALYRQDLRPVYNLLRPLFERELPELAFVGRSNQNWT